MTLVRSIMVRSEALDFWENGDEIAAGVNCKVSETEDGRGGEERRKFG